MRSMLETTLAVAVLAGAAVFSFVPAASADDAGSRTFWMAQPASPAATAPSNGNNAGYTASYDYKTQTEPSTTANAPEAKDPYFYHSMGTMGHP